MAKVKKWPVSLRILKYVILAMFILLPVLAFRFGMQYERQHGSYNIPKQTNQLP